MLNHFSAQTRTVVDQAAVIARELGSSSVEAEHLLLAVASSEGPTARTLHDHGLDFDGIALALAAETERSLAAVGVSAAPLDFAPKVGRPQFATSAKVALERMLKLALVRREKPLTTNHLVLGVLAAERGTVPRALECAGVDRDALRAAVEAAI